MLNEKLRRAIVEDDFSIPEADVTGDAEALFLEKLKQHGKNINPLGDLLGGYEDFISKNVLDPKIKEFNDRYIELSDLIEKLEFRKQQLDINSPQDHRLDNINYEIKMLGLKKSLVRVDKLIRQLELGTQSATTKTLVKDFYEECEKRLTALEVSLNENGDSKSIKAVKSYNNFKHSVVKEGIKTELLQEKFYLQNWIKQASKKQKLWL